MADARAKLRSPARSPRAPQPFVVPAAKRPRAAEASAAPRIRPATPQRQPAPRTGRVPEPDDLDEGTAVLYWGTKSGFVHDAFNALDEFWVSDAETGDFVRDKTGGIVAFKSKELSLVADTAPPSLPSTEGHSYSGALLVGREEHMVNILQHFGEADLQERRTPQLLLAIPCNECGPAELQTAACTGIHEELHALGRQLRPDIHVGVRALHLKQAVAKLGSQLLLLEGFYILAAVQLPYSLKSCEVGTLNMREKHRRKQIANQVDLTVSAMCEHKTSEDPRVAARRALQDQCRVDMTDSLWSEDVQSVIRQRLQVPDLPLRVQDQSGMEVVVVLLPDELTSLTLHGALTFSEPIGFSAAGEKDAAEAAEGTIQGKTVREWEDEQAEFANLPKLPTGWLRVKSRSSGEVYFFNKRTKDSTFDFPEAPLPLGWTKQVSKSTNKSYYWHAAKGASTFERPTQ